MKSYACFGFSPLYKKKRIFGECITFGITNSTSIPLSLTLTMKQPIWLCNDEKQHRGGLIYRLKSGI